MPLQEELRTQGDFLFRYRSYLPLALVSAGLWTEAYQERSLPFLRETLTAEIVEGLCLPIGLAGLAVRAFTVGYTPGRTSGRNTEEGQVAHVLNTTGAYSLVRNPLYLGNFLTWAAVAAATGSLWFTVVVSLVFWLYYERIVFAEEAFLRRRFGSTYLNWAARTPAFLPTHLRYVKPTVPFSWKKVLRNEKNGLFALALLLCLFRLVGDVAEGEVVWSDQVPWIAGAAATGAIYVALKGINRWTSVLNEAGR
ncbi:MAG: isoprenylcysteine carboxylmethyltransferase family protein [Planctomycetota bacterium]